MYQIDELNIDKVAIIGMALKVPGANSLEEFWELIAKRQESIYSKIKSVETEKMKRKYYFDLNTFIKNRKDFDASFFDVSIAQAKCMDPQQRCFLECTWVAIENAGYVPKSYEGIIGLYAGAYANTYMYQNIYPSMAADSSFFDNLEVLISNEKDHIASFTAYKMNLTGPVVNVQASCSSSLAAVHLACQGLLDYSCDMALAGAATIGASEKGGYYYQDTGLLSKDGHVRPFDKGATGTIYSEGIGVVVLKRLEDAIKDHDHIYAIIKGSAMNNDGSDRMGYSAPCVKGQSQVIRRAQLIAETEPETISYIEGHGTGTPLGDRIELEALHKIFQKTGQTGFCALGSIKGNIGHTGPASGVIGLIKTALALEKQLLPPSINYELENDAIDIFQSPFYVNTILQKWESDTGIRRAGVSSFGLGGTNVHVILENVPEYISCREEKDSYIFVLSAKTKESLRRMKQKYIDFLNTQEDFSLRDMVYTLQHGRENFIYRYSCIFDSRERLLEELTKPESWDRTGNMLPIALVITDELSGGSSLRAQLYKKEVCFQKAYDQVKTLLDQIPDYTQEQSEQLCVAYALGKIWLDWGVSFYKIKGIGKAILIAKALSQEINLKQMAYAYLTAVDADYEEAEEVMDEVEVEYIIFQNSFMEQKLEEVVHYRTLFGETCSAEQVYELLAKLWEKGYVKSMTGFGTGKKGERIPIPGYSFDRQCCWIEPVLLSRKENEETKEDNEYYIRTKEQMDGYMEPSGFVEKNLVRIWEKELGIKPVGVTDGFFQLGGTSLKAAKVNGIIVEFFDVDLTLQDFISCQTICDLKKLIMTL